MEENDPSIIPTQGFRVRHNDDNDVTKTFSVLSKFKNEQKNKQLNKDKFEK